MLNFMEAWIWIRSSMGFELEVWESGHGKSTIGWETVMRRLSDTLMSSGLWLGGVGDYYCGRDSSRCTSPYIRKNPRLPLPVID